MWLLYSGLQDARGLHILICACTIVVVEDYRSAVDDSLCFLGVFPGNDMLGSRELMAASVLAIIAVASICNEGSLLSRRETGRENLSL